MSPADIFLQSDALNLLRGKSILMFGDSNMRAMYKDILWLLEDGSLLPSRCLKLKNEPTHANDVNITNSELTSSRNYVEVRRYNKTCYVRFEFITRLFSENFVKTISELLAPIDIIILNSCLWDLTRWGPDGVREFKRNLRETFRFLRGKCPTSRVIWTGTLPPGFKARGGFLTEELNFLRDLLPFQVVEANYHAVNLAREFGIDVVDLHFHLRSFIDFRSNDSIHWEPLGLRFVTNIVLTHISMATYGFLPGRVALGYKYDVKLNRGVGNGSNAFEVVNCGGSKNNKRRKRERGRGDGNRGPGFDFNPKGLNYKFVNKPDENVRQNSNFKVTIGNGLYEKYQYFVRNVLSCKSS